MSNIFSAVKYRATNKKYSIFADEHANKTGEEKAALLRTADSFDLLHAYAIGRKVAALDSGSYDDVLLIERELLRRLSIYEACADAVLHR